jgi:hypothetical protein
MQAGKDWVKVLGSDTTESITNIRHRNHFITVAFQPCL